MHAIVFRITMHDADAAGRLLNEQFVPGMRQAPGFVAGWWVSTGETTGTSVIVFESEDAVRGVLANPSKAPEHVFTVDEFSTGPVVAHAGA